jgi:long-chain fatty acid transport protein
LTLLSGKQVLTGANIIMPSFKFDNQGSTTVLGTPLNGGNGGDAGGVHFVPNLFYSHDISDKLKVGIGIVSPFGLGTEYDDDWVGRYHTIKSELLTIDINPTIAYKINSMWSIGAGLSAQYMDAELTGAIDYGTIGFLSPFPGFTPQGNDGFSKITGDDWGFGFNLGVLLEPTEKTRFGLAYRSRISYELEGDADFTIPASPAFAPVLAGALFHVDTTAKADIDMPDSISLSAFHQLNDKWAIMADITWTNWSVLEELRIEFGSGADDSVVTFEWEDTFRYSVGATFTPNDKWTFRTGIAYDITPVPNSQRRTPRVPDETRIWLALGTSYQFTDRLGLDVGYTYIFADDAEINKTATGEDTFRGALVGEYDGSSNIISAQLSWNF